MLSLTKRGEIVGRASRTIDARREDTSDRGIGSAVERDILAYGQDAHKIGTQ